MKGWFERTLNGLRPSDEATAVILKKIPVGTTVECEVITRKPRSGQWHRRYWALMSLIAGNVEQVEIAPGAFMEIHDSEDAHTAMKLLTGHVTTYTAQIAAGIAVIRVPKPTSFTDMDSEEWSAYYKKTLDAVHRHVLPTIEDRYVEDEIARMAS